MRKYKTIALIIGALLLLTGCNKNQEELAEQVLGKVANALNDFNVECGDNVTQVLDNLKNAEYQGGPFENNLDSARAYLLQQMQKKYGIEFVIIGKETLENYGPFAGASYSCQVAPVDAPGQIATALVSQTVYQDVRDNYAVYFFQEEAQLPVLELCKTKDYIIDQRISLEMPETEKTWSVYDKLETFLSESEAYIKLVLRLPDNLDSEIYAEYLYDFLNSVDQLECNLLLQAKTNKIYIFHQELDILHDFDASSYTIERLKEEIETNLSIGAPQ